MEVESQRTTRRDCWTTVRGRDFEWQDHGLSVGAFTGTHGTTTTDIRARKLTISQSAPGGRQYSDIFSHLWLNFLLHLIVILWCSTRLCLGSYSFHNLCLTIASIVSSNGVNQQQYADDTQLILFISPASLSSRLCSLQGCVSSLHS